MVYNMALYIHRKMLKKKKKEFESILKFLWQHLHVYKWSFCYSIYNQVKLMKQVKEEADRNKQSEARRNKEVAQLKRDQIQKENRIRNLEKEKKQKETVLKRKVEEVHYTYIISVIFIYSIATLYIQNIKNKSSVTK